MSSTSMTRISEPATIPQTTFLGCLWGGVAITFCFIVLRLYVRVKVFHRLLADDAWILLSWIGLLAMAIVWQRAHPSLYLSLAVAAGRSSPPADFLSHVRIFSRANGAACICFFGGLWNVKFAFLVFFWDLEKKAERTKTLWWCIFVATICGCLVSFGLIDYQCAFAPVLDIIAYCTTPASARFIRTNLWMATMIDVITDLLILSLPINLIWKVRINLRQKLALSAIFSLTAFIMVVAIVRAALVSRTGKQFDMSLIWTWSAVEHAVALIVACLVSYRAYFTNRTASRQRSPRHNAQVRDNSATKEHAPQLPQLPLYNQYGQGLMTWPGEDEAMRSVSIPAQMTFEDMSSTTLTIPPSDRVYV